MRYDALPPPGPAPTETSPLIPPSSPNLGHSIRRRRQSVSHTSVASLAPSLAQKVLSLFQTIDDEEACESSTLNNRGEGEVSIDDFQSNGSEQRRLLNSSRDVMRSGYGREWVVVDDVTPEQRQQQSGRSQNGSLEACKRYFSPLTRVVYYRALFHILLLNFPYALVAWVYLFVFTTVSGLERMYRWYSDDFASQTGTTMLMALPLGAVLCFLDLLGARAFARGEVSHSPPGFPIT